jgi:hypothetical protein
MHLCRISKGDPWVYLLPSGRRQDFCCQDCFTRDVGGRKVELDEIDDLSLEIPSSTTEVVPNVPLIRLKRIYNFLCYMLVYAPFSLCFVYTSWCFYAFSRTNLLTRFHSASSCFLLFLCFRKVTQEILSELDKTKAEVPNYLT